MPQQAEPPEVRTEPVGAVPAIQDGSVEADVETDAAVPEGLVKAREHERFRKFFKMMDMHIPEQAVRIKIQAEEPDLDPDVLSDGDRLIPI